MSHTFLTLSYFGSELRFVKLFNAKKYSLKKKCSFSYYIEDKSDKDEEGGLFDFSQFDRGV
jgi:hypothetical protein